MTALEVAEVGILETRQERAQRRAALLRSAFQSVFEALAEIYRDDDWRYVNDVTGLPYSGFTAFVQDQLGCAASNARRYQQGIVGLVLPLQELALPGVRIPVTSADVARLGIAGARAVIEEAQSVLQDVTDCDEQSEVLRALIDSVARRTTSPGFGPIKTSVSGETSLGELVPAELPSPPPGPGSGSGWGQDCDDEPCAGPKPSWAVEGCDNDGAEVSAVAGRRAAAADGRGPVVDSVVSPMPESMSLGAGACSEDAVENRPASEGREVDIAGLAAAVGAVLATADPAALAEQVPRRQSTTLAADCLAAAQRLARLGQLLRTVSS